jgi:hypothetical protein
VFTIHALSPEGVPLKSGGTPFKVEVTDASGDELPCEVKDNGDGTYTCTYYPQKTEIHTVAVMLQNPHEPLFSDHIKDSPFYVAVAAGIDPGKCVLEGPGLQSGVPEDTKPATFRIHPKDINGEDVLDGDEPFDVEVIGPDGKKVPVDINKNPDGSYDVTYHPKVAGPHKINVLRKGPNGDKHLANSPYNVDVIEGADDENTHVGWYSFTIQARDKKGNPLTKGGDIVEVTIKCDARGAEPVGDITTTDNQNGSYTVVYKLEEPGKYIIHVNINGKKLKGSPIRQTMA